MREYKSLKNKRKIMKVNPYDMWVVIDFSPYSYTSKFLGREEMDKCSALCVYPEILGFSGNNIPDVVMAFFDYSTNTLAHECVHAANYILSNVQVEITPDNDEALAYLVGWLAQEVNNFYHEIVEENN